MTRFALFLTFGLLAACTRPEPAPELPPPASPTGDAPAPTVPPPASEETPAPPSDAPAGPDQPSPEAPPPTEPSPAPKPTSSEGEPALEAMRVARSNAKMGVPVDLLYSFDGDVVPGQPVQLHLAAVPRVAGSDLRISVQQAPGLEFSAGTMNVRKAEQAGVYRKQLALTRRASGPSEVRVLITLGPDGGSAHGFYTIPLEPGKISQTPDSVKQR
jgi:hypothetical protein